MKHLRKLAGILLSALLLASTGVSAGLAQGRAVGSQAGGSAAPLPPILLRSGAVHLQARDVPQSTAASTNDQPSLFLVQFRGPIRAEQVRRLEQLGAEVGDYLPEYAFLVRATAAVAQQIRRLDFIQGVGPYEARHKLDPALKNSQGAVAVRAVSFGGSTKQSMSQLNAMGGTVLGFDGPAVVARVDAARLHDLAASPDLVWVEPVRQRRLFNDQAAQITGVSGAAWPQGLDGRGQVIGVADTGLDTGNARNMHPDLGDRVQNIFALGRPGDASDPHGHGTHVVGSILGTGAASGGKIRGMAPAAKIVFQSVLDGQGGLGGIPDDLATLFAQAYDAGARIHSDSWGVPATAGGAVYDTQAAAVDRFVWERGDMSIVIAAGNDGDHDQDGQPNYGTVSTPGTAKNAITVGASENRRPDKGKHADDPDAVALFSSRGQTVDGRTKPDVVAPGSWILSTKSSRAPAENFWQGYDGQYAFMGGTSMAAPVAAGAVAVLRQYFVEKRAITPAAALLKAALLHGARPLQGTARDYGWGRVDVGASLAEGLQVVNETVALETGKAQDYIFQVDGSGPFRVTLVWTDYPGAPEAGKALVNDLDLEVHTPAGEVRRGGGDSPDRVNNVEQVTVTQPRAGVYTVRVQAHNVPRGPQRFALVVTGGRPAGDAPPADPPQDPQPPPDAVPPAVRLQSPRDGAELQGTVTLAAAATDDASGVARVEFYADDRLLGQDTAAPYAVEWDTRTVADGTYRLTARAFDVAGNRAESEPVTVTVRNTAPPPAPGPDAAVREVFTGESTGWSRISQVHFSTGAGQVQLETLTTAQLGVDVKVLDAAGQVVGGAVDAGANNPIALDLKAGTYTVQVVIKRGWGHWQVSVTHPPAARMKQQTWRGAVNAGFGRSNRAQIPVGKSGVLNLALTWQGWADLDLYLVDGLGRLVGLAGSADLATETISVRVAPGLYTAWVVADMGGASYTLTATYPQ